MTPTPPRQTPPSYDGGWGDPAADEVVPPSDRLLGISRRLVAVAGTALIAAIVVVVLSSLA